MKIPSYKLQATGCRHIVESLFCLLPVACCLLLTGCSQNPFRKTTQVLMGTYVEVISDHKEAAKIAFAEIRRLDNLLSKFNPQSEVSQLNQKGILRVSPDTLKVIELSLEFNQKSSGAFDITVGPLADIWKQTIKTRIMPKTEAINAARILVGSDKIFLDKKNSVVRLSRPGMEIDLGGIAKGYAVDCAIKKLKEAGITSCLVNAGGNMSAIGKRGGKPWKIGIRHPRKPNKIIGFIFLENQAVATSGDYEQYVDVSGTRYSHIIDPKTGYPVNNDMVSVTVISQDAATCDALGTAVFVLGKEKGRQLTNQFAKTTLIAFNKGDLKK